VETNERDIRQLSERQRAIHDELDLRSRNRANLSAEQFHAQIAMFELVSTDYFVPEIFTAESLLQNWLRPVAFKTKEQQAEARRELSSLLQKILGDWNSVWAERPQGAADGNGLY
jgi:hypothetical protein